MGNFESKGKIIVDCRTYGNDTLFVILLQEPTKTNYEFT